MKLHRPADKSISRTFDSWMEFVNLAENGQSEITNNIRSSQVGFDSFAGCSFQEALNLAKVGWPQGVSDIRNKIDILWSTISTKRSIPEMRMSYVGPGTLDIKRYNLGHPQPYVTWVPGEQESEATGSIVKLVCNGTASSGVSVGTLFSRGARVCVLTDLLEKAGKRVEISIAFRVKGRSSGEIQYEIPIKGSQDPLDIDRIAFSLAHASTLRRLAFSVLEQENLEVRGACGIIPGGGYGVPGDLPTTGIDIYIPAASGYKADMSDKAQLDWLKQNLTAQGVEILDDK